MSVKVCIIGAGPCGMSLLLHLQRLKKSGKDIEVICYEKQTTWGGLWNYTWRTSSDEFGEPVHGSMYHALWANGPKESFELPDYLCDEHFGKELPSFLPREAVFDYLQGRWNSENLRESVTFEHVVRSVTHNKESDKFTVIAENLREKQVLPAQEFDYVIVATGHYSTPNFPEYPGIDTFPGRVLHSHDFRSSVEFSGQKILLIGSSYSGEDIAVQAIKYGAKEAIVSYRSVPTGMPWPDSISERPLLTKVEGNTAYFSDGSSADNIDSIIFCTGYIGHYPFMDKELRHRSSNSFYPPDLYKGILFVNGGNNKIIYLGRQDVIYTFTMFDVQAFWTAQYISGNIELPSKDEMKASITHWFDRCMAVMTVRDLPGCVDFQGDYIKDMIKDSKYPYEIDCTVIWNQWLQNKAKSGAWGYRNYSHTSIFTKKEGVKPKIPYLENMNHTLKAFLDMY